MASEILQPKKNWVCHKRTILLLMTVESSIREWEEALGKL